MSDAGLPHAAHGVGGVRAEPIGDGDRAERPQRAIDIVRGSDEERCRPRLRQPRHLPRQRARPLLGAGQPQLAGEADAAHHRLAASDARRSALARRRQEAVRHRHGDPFLARLERHRPSQRVL
jgi:hypothetical protein